MTEPRQFWLDQLSKDDHGWLDAIPLDKGDNEEYKNYLRVIEYSAFAELEEENAALKSRIEKLREIISQINIDNPSFDDARIDWIEVQIDRWLVNDIRAALKADEWRTGE